MKRQRSSPPPRGQPRASSITSTRPGDDHLDGLARRPVVDRVLDQHVEDPVEVGRRRPWTSDGDAGDGQLGVVRRPPDARAAGRGVQVGGRVGAARRAGLAGPATRDDVGRAIDLLQRALDLLGGPAVEPSPPPPRGVGGARSAASATGGRRPPRSRAGRRPSAAPARGFLSKRAADSRCSRSPDGRRAPTVALAARRVAPPTAERRATLPASSAPAARPSASTIEPDEHQPTVDCQHRPAPAPRDVLRDPHRAGSLAVTDERHRGRQDLPVERLAAALILRDVAAQRGRDLGPVRVVLPIEPG